jgi:hypothetical protein
MQDARSRFVRIGPSILLALAALGCASQSVAADNRPIEYLDETTGATVTTVGRPLVFIRDSSRAIETGAEYITLAPARIDRSGRIQYVLVAYLWSVGTGADLPAANADRLLIEAGAQTLTLQSIGHSVSDLGVQQPIHPPPLGTAIPYFYIVDIPTYRAIATRQKVNLQLPGTPIRTYTIFDDHFRAFAEFVRAISALDE